MVRSHALCRHIWKNRSRLSPQLRRALRMIRPSPCTCRSIGGALPFVTVTGVALICDWSRFSLRLESLLLVTGVASSCDWRRFSLRRASPRLATGVATAHNLGAAFADPAKGHFACRKLRRRAGRISRIVWNDRLFATKYRERCALLARLAEN